MAKSGEKFDKTTAITRKYQNRLKSFIDREALNRLKTIYELAKINGFILRDVTSDSNIEELLYIENNFYVYRGYLDHHAPGIFRALYGVDDGEKHFTIASIRHYWGEIEFLSDYLLLDGTLAPSSK